ncbi:hypothetical protein VTK73DRAFT_6091 [Phialemonium thermophilum]|uniref:GH16 domain-containing protein n=1 Tax=Phialemonium thermophilum TaxID=223376 RepID=A0ABR3WL44_9PEZI
MRLHILSCLMGSIAIASHHHPGTVVIPRNSFRHFDAYWNELYPWGDTHNGAARMVPSHIRARHDGVLDLISEPVTGQPDATFNGQPLPIHYLSGTVYAKTNITVEAGGGYDFSAEFIAPTHVGTWPAFWITSAVGWPPEIDIAEWKGTGDISFNTFNTSTVVKALDIPYPNPRRWHSVRAEIRDENGSDVSVRFYLDGTLRSTQYGSSYVGVPMYFIIDYQMEGSSGTPGPDFTTTFSIRSVEVLSFNPSAAT